MKYVTFFDEKYIYGIHYLEDMVNGFKYTDVAYVTKGSFIANNEVKGIDHNYVLEYSDKFSSIFNLDKISLDSIINNRAVTAKGYSIDPFEIEISA